MRWPLNKSMEKIIEVQNLSVSFNGHSILQNISFDVAKQEIVAIIGPNGSGKTTIIRALLGLLPISGGHFKVNSPSLGYVPQRLDFDRSFPLTVKELFLTRLEESNFWLSAGVAGEKIVEYLKQAGAQNLIDKNLGALSGGEWQRVLIAFALIDKPEILFLDEPLAGVDVAGEETIQDMLERLHEKFKLTILLVSHDLEVVFKHASKVICVNKNLVCVGRPGEVLTTENLIKLYGPVRAFYHHHGEHSAG